MYYLGNYRNDKKIHAIIFIFIYEVIEILKEKKQKEKLYKTVKRYNKMQNFYRCLICKVP